MGDFSAGISFDHHSVQDTKRFDHKSAVLPVL